MADETVTPTLLSTSPAGSDDWRAEREYRIGGSEIAAVIGLSPWSSRFTLYAEKKGVLPAREDTPETEWGRRHESTVFYRVREDVNETDFAEAAPGLYAHTERSWQVASPDGVVYDDDQERWPGDPDPEAHTVIEIKTAQRGEKWGPQGSDEFPVYYRTQLIWNMNVMGAREGILAVLIGLSDYRTYRISMDDQGVTDDLALMLRHGERFVQALRDNNWPDPDDGSTATYEALRTMHPEIEEGTQVELSSDLADSLILSKAALTQAEKDYAKARALVAAEMGTAQHAWSNGVHIAARYAKTAADGSPGRPYVEADRRQTNMRYRTITEALEES